MSPPCHFSQSSLFIELTQSKSNTIITRSMCVSDKSDYYLPKITLHSRPLYQLCNMALSNKYLYQGCQFFLFRVASFYFPECLFISLQLLVYAKCNFVCSKPQIQISMQWLPLLGVLRLSDLQFFVGKKSLILWFVAQAKTLFL